MSENERASIQSEGLSKIRYKSGDKKTSGVDKENKLNDVYGNKFRIPLDHGIIKDHAVSLTSFFLIGLSSSSGLYLSAVL